jgi:hypothetical protein
VSKRRGRIREFRFISFGGSTGRAADLLAKFIFMVELNSKQKGNLTELKCLSAFYELGYQCSIPYGENSRYDLIADIDGKLIRVQCKTSREIAEGVIEFACRSSRSNTQSNVQRKYTADEIDYFCTFWNEKCYLIPISECSVSKKLRFVPPKNGQKVGITYAKDYELQGQLEKIKRLNIG